MVNVKNLRLCTFAQSVIKASDRHVPLFSRKWRRLPFWSLEQRRRREKAPLDGSFYLDAHESVVAKVIVDPSWPHFQHPRPARITSPRLPLGILCRALTTRPSHWPRPPTKPITFTFPLEDIRASLVILAWNRSATAPLETKPRSGWVMAWQIIRRREQKESKDRNQLSGGLTDKYYAPSAKNWRSLRVLRVIFRWV